jgi:hypothetical protein
MGRPPKTPSPTGPTGTDTPAAWPVVGPVGPLSPVGPGPVGPVGLPATGIGSSATASAADLSAGTAPTVVALSGRTSARVTGGGNLTISTGPLAKGEVGDISPAVGPIGPTRSPATLIPDAGPHPHGPPPAGGRTRVTRARTTVPDQLPAPVRVEERDGKIARVSDRDSPLRCAERDFNGWREPVLVHVEELLSGDFRQGTNQGRARDRLVALGKLLPGSIAEVKERQFRIGYEIERLEGLVAAYRSSADDMPVLNAAVLEDLDRLRIALVMGIDKLERWAEFRRAAADDPMQEGSANPVVIGDALNSMAVEMERQPKYFDPELPETFRFMAEAARDPQGATKTVVYGAVRSAENVVSFLGQRALGIGINAVGAVEQHISKAVATSLIAGLSGVALNISGALPAGWAWLKPLLDALTKAGGG